jgi:hypothetical protein
METRAPATSGGEPDVQRRAWQVRRLVAAVFFGILIPKSVKHAEISE